MPLSNEERDMYTELDRTYNTPGFTHLLNGWKEELDALPERAFFNCKTIEELNEFKVRYGLLRELIDLPDAVTSALAPEEEDE